MGDAPNFRKHPFGGVHKKWDPTQYIRMARFFGGKLYKVFGVTNSRKHQFSLITQPEHNGTIVSCRVELSEKIGVS